MKSLLKDFVLAEDGHFTFRIGHWTATSLSGFAAGAISASIIWVAAVWIVKMFRPDF